MARLLLLFACLLHCTFCAAQGSDVDSLRKAESLRGEGAQLLAAQRYADALQPLQQALTLYTEAGPQDRRLIGLLAQLSYARYKLAQYPEALALDERRLQLSRQVQGQKHTDTLQALRDVAIAYENVYPDGYARAIPLLEEALPLRIEVSGERDWRSKSLMVDLANAYHFTGRGADALALYERQARVVAAEKGADSPEAVQALVVVALAYDQLGRHAEAIPIFEKDYQLTLKQKGAASRDAVFDMVRLGGAYVAADRVAEGLPLLEQAIELRKTVFPSRDRETISFYSTLGDAYSRAGRIQEALTLFGEALRLDTEDAGEKSFVALRDLSSVAAAQAQLGHTEEALTLHERAYALRGEVLGPGHPETLQSLQQVARMLERLGRPREAMERYARLIPAVEALRASGDLSPENRQALFAQWVGAYKAYAVLLVAEGQAAEAFRIAELSKARTLLESTAMRRASQDSVLASGEAGRLRALESRIATLNDGIAASLRAEQRFALESEKNRLIAALAQLRRELQAKYPKFARLSEVNIADADSGRQSLPAGAVLLSYIVSDERAAVFALTADGPEARVIEHADTLAESISHFRQRISDPNQLIFAREAREEAAALGAILLAPVAAQIHSSKRMFISPDGPLALLPFEVLELEGQPLVVRADVSYAQSLSMMALLKAQGESAHTDASRDLFAMGGAIYTRPGAAPARSGATTAKPAPARGTDIGRLLAARGAGADSTQRAFDSLHIEWVELPGSEKEVDAVAGVFGDTRSKVYKKSDATEAKLLELNRTGELARYRYLLFSAHGYLSTEEPGLSSLVLGQVDKAPGTDGYVSAGEWPGYNLASELVVLSACETGVGRVVQGEGVTGLPYALFVAGNRNTLLSLWPVVDESTARFMTAFFTRIAAGMPQAAALSEVKRRFLANRDYAQPLFWAPFVLYGN